MTALMIMYSKGVVVVVVVVGVLNTPRDQSPVNAELLRLG